MSLEKSPFFNYSLRDPAVLVVRTRQQQAKKIWAVLAHYRERAAGSTRLCESLCLDIGCSAGVITRSLAAHLRSATGIDVDWHALTTGWQMVGAQHHLPTASRAAASGVHLPFADCYFDVVVGNQVYQYVPDVPQLAREIHRILKPGGCCFWSARNLWGVLSPQNWRPFLSSLRLPVGGSGAWQHRAGTLWSYRALQTLLTQDFRVHDYTIRALTERALADIFLPSNRARRALSLVHPLLHLLHPLMPTHLWVLEKPLTSNST